MPDNIKNLIMNGREKISSSGLGANVGISQKSGSN